LVALVTLLNALGTKLSASVNNVFVAIKVGVLVLFSALGLLNLNLGNFDPFAPHGFAPVLQAAALFYFAYIGFPRIAVLAEELKDPERDLPRAILTALWSSAVIYLLVSLAAVGVAGWERLAASKAPLEEVARVLGVGWVVGVGGLVATFSVVLTSVMGQSRVFFAMARNQEIPRTLSAVHPRLGTPIYSVLLSGSVMMALVLTLDISGLAMVTSFLVLLSHVLTNVAALRLYQLGRAPPFKAPLRPIHAAAGAILSAVLALSVEPRAQTFGCAILLAGATWYSLYTRLARAERKKGEN
jgi:APA family basic amino acid/polyamine antiporter